MKKLQTDYAIQNATQDELERAKYAESIADILLAQNNEELEEGIVLGLYGSWGSGKTSFINLVKESLCSKCPNIIKSAEKYTKLKQNINKYFNFLCIFLLCSFDFIYFLSKYNIFENITDSFYHIYPHIFLVILITVISCQILLSIFICTYQPFNIGWIIDLIIAFGQKIKILQVNKNQSFMLDFAPWNIANPEIIIDKFFKTLMLCISDNYMLKQGFNKYLANLCNKISNGFVQIENYSDTLNLKNELSNLLKGAKNKFYVFIDDIDRLSSEEVYWMFRIIKSIANLPNIIYIISVDKDIVINSIENYNKSFGKNFIDKIIQIPVNLPIIKEKHLQNYVFKQLQMLLGQSPISDEQWQEYYQDYWSTIYAPNFHIFFKNIRDVKQFINVFKLSYSIQIQNEVNIIDMWLINAIKLFIPKLYDFIREHKTFLTSTQRNNMYSKPDEKEINYYKTTLDNILSEIPFLYVKKLRFIVWNLFPNLAILDNSIYINYANKKHQFCRVCSREYFDNYFVYDTDSETFTNSYVLETIALSQDYPKLVERFNELDEKNKLKEFLQKLENYTDKKIQSKSIQNIIKAFFEQGDLFKPYNDEFLGFDIYVSMERIIYQLLENNNTNSINLLQNSLSLEKSIIPAISFAELIKRLIEQQSSLNYANQTMLEYFSQNILTAIREWAENDIEGKVSESKPYNGCIIKHRRASNILYFWSEFGSKEEVITYISRIIETDSGLLNLLDKFKHVVKSSSMNGYNTYHRIYAKDLERYFNLDDLVNRLNALNQEDLSDNDKETIKLVLDGIKNKDKDPYYDEDDNE